MNLTRWLVVGLVAILLAVLGGVTGYRRLVDDWHVVERVESPDLAALCGPLPVPSPSVIRTIDGDGPPRRLTFIPGDQPDSWGSSRLWPDLRTTGTEYALERAIGTEWWPGGGYGSGRAVGISGFTFCRDIGAANRSGSRSSDHGSGS